MGKKPKKTENKDAGFQTQLAEKMDLKWNFWCISFCRGNLGRLDANCPIQNGMPWEKRGLFQQSKEVLPPRGIAALRGWQALGTGYNIMRGNRISFHSVAVKCLIAWSALLIGNTVQIRNSPRYCNTDGRSCMPLGFYLGRLCVPDDVKSGDLLPCFAITFGGKVRNNCCLNAFCAFYRQWRPIPCRFFYKELQFCKMLSLYAERRACLRENHAAHDWWTSGFPKHME